MTSPTPYSKAVMDFFPWPMGLGFVDADRWWNYVLVQSEDDRLNLLIMVALLDQALCRLLLRHDRALLDRFSFSDKTLQLLCEIEAETLSAFAQELTLKRSSRGSEG